MSQIRNAVVLASFQVFSHGWLLLCLSRTSLSSTYYYVFFFTTPFLFEINCAYNRGGLNPACKWLLFVHLVRLVLLLLFKCFIILILSVLARHINLM